MSATADRTARLLSMAEVKRGPPWMQATITQIAAATNYPLASAEQLVKELDRIYAAAPIGPQAKSEMNRRDDRRAELRTIAASAAGTAVGATSKAAGTSNVELGRLTGDPVRDARSIHLRMLGRNASRTS